METHFNPENMDANADRVARFLKSIANRVRLRILCCLMQGEKAAGGLSRELGISQANLNLSWGKVTISIFTHKIDGLTKSDFVLASKIDQT